MDEKLKRTTIDNEFSVSEGSRYIGDSFNADMPEQGIHPLFPDEVCFINMLCIVRFKRAKQLYCQ